jgi:tetratricopeptide (TPR) repeat protein
MTAAKEGTRLEGVEVAITGRLASMSREEAVEYIGGAGGSYAKVPTAGTAYLVFGQGGPPIGEDGQLTQNLLRARELQRAGALIEILPESEWVARFGLAQHEQGLHRLYTIEQLSRILDVTSREIRNWMRHGLITPSKVVKRLCFFEFSQVASARALAGLARSGVSLRRIRESLQRLSGWMQGRDCTPAHFESLERCDTLLVRLEDGRLAEPGGQLRLEFGEDESSHEIATVHEASPADSRGWFEAGLDLDAHGQFEDAAAAYRRAATLEDPSPEVFFNLGNALYSLQDTKGAVMAFECATTADPEYVEAWNNLGNMQSELEDHIEAARAYRQAIQYSPYYADAHFNLADTLEDCSDLSGARRHYKKYLELDPNGPTASEVRERLKRLDYE